MPDSAQLSDRWAAKLTKSFLRAEAKAGRTPKETAAAVGCSENTVRDQLARHGLLAVDGAPKSLVRDYAKHRSITALANVHGVSFSTARRWLLAAGVEINDAHRPTHTGLDVEHAAVRYEGGESLATIAGKRASESTRSSADSKRMAPCCDREDDRPTPVDSAGAMPRAIHVASRRHVYAATASRL